MVQLLDQHHASLAACDANGLTPLDLALNSIDTAYDMVLLLLARGAAQPTILGSYPDALQALLEEGLVDVSLVDHFGSLLHSLCAQPHLEIGCSVCASKVLSQCLQPGIPLNYARPSDGYTALQIACAHGHAAAVKLLLAHGADPLLDKDTVGLHPIKMAAANDHLACIEAFFKATSCSWNAIDPRLLADQLLAGRQDVALVLLKHSFCTQLDNGWAPDGMAALHVAACLGYPLIVKELIKKGASLDVRDQYNRTPLRCVAERLTLDRVVFANNACPEELRWIRLLRENARILLTAGASPGTDCVARLFVKKKKYKVGKGTRGKKAWQSRRNRG